MDVAVYEHRQTSWMPTLLGAAVLAAFVALILTMVPLSEWLLALIVIAALLGLTVFAALLSCMTIRIVDDQLRWSFGLFGWPRWSVPLESIVAVETTRTRVLDGWGVHLTKRGWLYNITGLDAVLIRRDNAASFLLGTDEPQQLALALDSARADAKRMRKTRMR